jgi:Mn2+/Fe2+ NRAMP family transporter
MIVRRRWRRLRSGAGWTWTGLSFLLVCWLIWAVSVRGGDPIGPLLALVMVLVFAAFMFVVARLLGRAVLEQTLGRERPSAWPSHLTVCVFVTLAGLAFLQQTQWIQDSWRWLSDSRQSLLDLWPL